MNMIDQNIIMKTLLVYFSISGRTRKIAHAIAETLPQANIQVEELKFNGRLSELMVDQNKTGRCDISKFTYNPAILDLTEYDRIFFGTPTYGARPAIAFNTYLENAKNLEGKDWFCFATGRIMPGKIFELMRQEIEKTGGKLNSAKYFKGFFRLGTEKAIIWARSLNI
jgi:flavodoxin